MGQTKATIYRTPSRGYDSFTVVWFEGANRKRKVFSAIEDAELHASSMVNSLSKGEAEILRLTGEERLAFVRAKSTLAEFELSLDSIAVEYRDAKRLAKGASLVDVSRYFAQHKLHDLPDKSVFEVYEEMIRAKRGEGLSELYLHDLKMRAGKFAKDFHGKLVNVQMSQIRDWLQAMDIANRTRNNFRMAIQTLFAYAKTQKYLPADWNEIDAIPVWKITKENVEIFTPQEMGKILAVANENLIPFLAIGAFAGLRTAEIERLEWSKINMKSGFITIDASIAKTNSRRVVPIQKNLKAWLKPFVKEVGKVVEIDSISNAIFRLIEKSNGLIAGDSRKPATKKIEWRRNALRHSYCSYRLAKLKNAAEVALEAGNSPQIIFKHYRELVTPKEADQWFSISPTD